MARTEQFQLLATKTPEFMTEEPATRPFSMMRMIARWMKAATVLV
jgi:hypothetical protein